MKLTNAAIPSTRWRLARPASRAELLERMDEFGVSPMLAQVLHARGLSRAHLYPRRTLTPNPGIVEAARRIVQAIRHDKKIRVHGDYDADGVSATALLVLGLRKLGADIHGFIPHRLKDGYGIHPDKVAQHAEACDLLITVDCGVSNAAEVQSLLAAGIEVIVTDHHLPPANFPDCLVVHPHLTPHYDPALHNLTGAGVAYHLLWAVHEELHEPEPMHLAPLATLGTVADVAPLLGENRALVLAGLSLFPETELPGLKVLLEGKGLTSVSARDVAFILAPRINAAGRLGEADLALELLTTDSPRRAEELAIYLETRNNERRVLQDAMFEQALLLADPADPAIVVTHEGWHAGIMGIVAAKLLETYHKPVYIVAEGKGSVRSTPGISAVGGLHHAAAHLKRYGGHPAAAGFALKDGQYDKLRDSLHEYARQFPRPVPELHLEASLPAWAVTAPLWAELEGLQPFGEGFPDPLWHLSGELESARMVGKTASTLQFVLKGVKGVKYRESAPGAGVRDLAAKVQLNSFRGVEKVELMLEGLRPLAKLELAGSPDTVPADFQRLKPVDGVAHLRTGASAYATGSVAAYLQDNVPGVRLLESGQALSGEVVLYALPPEADLTAWLSSGRVSFAWGPKTLEQLEASFNGRERGNEAKADAYRRWQWAQLYQHLDDAGWAQAVLGMTGMKVEEAELAGVAD
ncbi:single-stranded-DNA-specific exonuclease RecJ [Deinococcus ruber]|uniref:Single-stranded-DNA-specific exonuclease RecJ n=1 Tax=Deinococcus ruber TaxID=1848197 RepID=A0A918KX62_9DEIO|nr:DHH family phosphoesterase [Deinococcus ruber]GGR39006.1 single-stranded-DNA-specific exonuclease [Deinococcus ruber]